MVRMEGREGGREGSFAVDGGALKSRPKSVGSAAAAGAAAMAAVAWV